MEKHMAVETSGVAVDVLEKIADSFRHAAQTEYPKQVELAASTIADAFTRGKKLLIFGNGGSASDAQHLAGELVVRFQATRRALPAIALGSDMAVLTACGNDFCFDEIYSRQIEALGTAGDIALGITTSGNSKNVLLALQASKQLGMTNILMTGSHGGQAKSLSDIVLSAPSSTTARIQELHLAGYHIICQLIDERFAGVSVV